MVQTSTNAPRTDDGGTGSDAACRGIYDGVGAGPLLFFSSDTGGPPTAKSPDGPSTPGSIPSPQRAQPALPSAPGSTVRADGSVVYHMALPEPPSIRNGGIGIGLTYRTWTDAAYQEGSATEGFGESLHFSFIDQVTETEGNLQWITGTGDVNLAVPDTGAQYPLSESWWVVQDHFALSRFRMYLRNGEQSPTLERYRPNGTVIRYQPKPNTPGVWRPAKYFDSYDNAWTFTWRSDYRIDKISDARGMETRFAWTVGSPTTCSVSYWKGAQHFTDWDWSMQLDASSQGRLTSIQLPATSYVVDDANGPLLDVANPVTDARVVTFTYHSSGVEAGLLNTITDSRLASGGSAYVVRQHTYAVALGRTRIATQIDEQGLIHSFAYSQQTPYVSLAYSAAESGAGGSATTITLDLPESVLNASSGTPWLPARITVTPGSLGKPRVANGDTDVEPSSLTWQIAYSGCACGLISSVITPSGALYALAHDEFGNLTSWTGPNPAGTGNVTHTWTYHGLDRAGRPMGYDAPLGADLSYDYLNSWITRTDQLYGQKPQSVEVRTTPITGSSSGAQILSTRIDFDQKGRPAQVTDVGGVVFDHIYGATGTSGSDLLVGITRVVPQGMGGDTPNQVAITIDDLGRVTQVREGSSTHQTVIDVVNDPLGRTKSVTNQLGTTGVSSVTEYFRDAFENVAVIRRKNLDENGSKPLGTARTWLRDEWHYHYDRLLESYMDRASVELAENLQDPTGSTLGADQRHLAWMARYQFGYRVDGQLETVTLPNDAVNKYEIDGYGTLYRIVADQGGLGVELGRSYFDSDLVLKRQRRLLNATTQEYAITQYVRNNGGLGPIYRNISPTGLYTDVGFDALERAVSVIRAQNSTTLLE
ncbi:MAG: hypothetical protein HZB39_09860 [Planctomycetes bacterium]|nr:hypothetical protein [Planctomycetota bacterium]